MPSRGVPPYCLQVEFGTNLLNQKLEINETEDVIAHEYTANYEEDEDLSEERDDWEEDAHRNAVTNCFAEQDFDEESDDQVRWDRNHDFSQLHQERVEPLKMQEVELKCKNTLESEREISSQLVDKNSLKLRQKIVHDLIIKGLKLSKGKSSVGGSYGASRLQFLLVKYSMGKERVLGRVIDLLK